MGLLKVAARTAVISGTATAVSGRVARRQAAAYAQAAPPAPPPPAPASPPGPAQAQDETIVRLQDLARLHGAGVLSDAEFTAAKAKVLGL